MRISDWSSDVCSSDLARARQRQRRYGRLGLYHEEWKRRPAKAPRLSPGDVRHSPCRSASRTGGPIALPLAQNRRGKRSEEHTSELQSLMRISYAVFCLKKKTSNNY